MEEIKFRAWNKKERSVHYFTLEDLINNKTLHSLKNWRFDLFTGLQDRFRKDIYDGDYVESKIGDETDRWVIDMSTPYWHTSPKGHSFDNSWIQFEVIGNNRKFPTNTK